MKCERRNGRSRLSLLRPSRFSPLHFPPKRLRGMDWLSSLLLCLPAGHALASTRPNHPPPSPVLSSPEPPPKQTASQPRHRPASRRATSLQQLSKQEERETRKRKRAWEDWERDYSSVSILSPCSLHASPRSPRPPYRATSISSAYHPRPFTPSPRPFPLPSTPALFTSHPPYFHLTPLSPVPTTRFASVQSIDSKWERASQRKVSLRGRRLLPDQGKARNVRKILHLFHPHRRHPTSLVLLSLLLTGPPPPPRLRHNVLPSPSPLPRPRLPPAPRSPVRLCLPSNHPAPSSSIRSAATSSAKRSRLSSRTPRCCRFSTTTSSSSSPTAIASRIQHRFRSKPRSAYIPC